MPFIETPTFPVPLSYGTQGGPRFVTNVTVLQSGYEQRNSLWSQGRHMYDASFAVKTREDLDMLNNFFHACKGQWLGFRFRDPFDYTTGAVVDPTTFAPHAFDDIGIAIGDGVETVFPLLKTYIAGTEILSRLITKPRTGTVLIGVDGVELANPADFAVDTTTGLVTFVVAPGDTLEITAGFEFDVPCRFGTDHISIIYDDPAIHSSEVPLVEILPYE